MEGRQVSMEQHTQSGWNGQKVAPTCTGRKGAHMPPMWPCDQRKQVACVLKTGCREKEQRQEGVDPAAFRWNHSPKTTLPRQITRLSSFPFLKFDFSSESKELLVVDFLNAGVMNVPGLSDGILPFYYCLNLWKLNLTWMSCSLCTLHTDLVCPFHARPFPQCIQTPVCITTDFLRMHACGNGLDELPNWRFYLNGKRCLSLFLQTVHGNLS